jgi:hypothetical protein
MTLSILNIARQPPARCHIDQPRQAHVREKTEVIRRTEVLDDTGRQESQKLQCPSTGCNSTPAD